MIISHEHKFIFIKPLSVGGSALELALKPILGPQDIMTDLYPYYTKRSSLEFDLNGQNNKGYHSYMRPRDIRNMAKMRSTEYKQFGENIFEEYEKIVIVRNPWDNFITQFENAKKDSKQSFAQSGLFKKIFEIYHADLSEKSLLEEINDKGSELQQRLADNAFFDVIENWPPRLWLNLDYYYQGNELISDTHFKYENLQEDFTQWYEKKIGENAPTIIHTTVGNQIQISREEYFLKHADTSVDPERIQGQIRRKVNLIMYKDDQYLKDFPYEFWSKDPMEIITNYKNNYLHKRAV